MPLKILNTLSSCLAATSTRLPDSVAIQMPVSKSIKYSELNEQVQRLASGLIRHGLRPNDRVAVYLNKSPEAIAAFFGINLAGGIFIPVNPVLKGRQVSHILCDSQAKILITSQTRYQSVCNDLAESVCLDTLVSVDGIEHLASGSAPQNVVNWPQLIAEAAQVAPPQRVDQDIASIFYTSGSTGNPKGVVLTNRNMICGAESVASYLNNSASDRLLAVLPFSFDYGFSQLTTAFLVGASVVPLDHLLAKDVINTICRTSVTGLAGVPPLWVQLAGLEWPAAARESLRYCTNSGGRMPKSVLAKLRAALPDTEFFLMYGLTEAFRSTFLPPRLIDAKPDSIGKAIPNAEVLVVDENGGLCPPGQPGELVHRGSLVAAGYWQDPDKTALRFRPSPRSLSGRVLHEIAVWSGDKVVSDEDGYLYFVGRDDEMIKSSGYRISPTEVEEAIYESGLVADAMVTSADDEQIGATLLAAVTPSTAGQEDSSALLAVLRSSLPAYMIPRQIFWFSEFPKNPNGKLDRPGIHNAVLQRFADEVDPDV